MVKEKTGSRSFGTLTGVFIPTFLSIVGVILFLRLGYVVGGAGLLGTIIIITLAVSISLSTGLALSSIVSNIRIGAGGAYSIVSKTLGLEIGGSVGIPLYLAQSLSVTLYIFGFAEAWQFLFPGHSIPLVAISAFLLLFLLIFLSTKAAVKIQVGVFFLILVALAIVFLGGTGIEGNIVTAVKSSKQSLSFWTLFAIFFPAVTGLMSGIGMYGELTDPKRQIPKGVLYGLGITTVIYLAMAVWLALSATPQALISNKLIIAQISAHPELVIIGILAATFSSALTMFIAAPRVLQALGGNSILPKSKFFTKRTKKGEPRNAVLVTGAIIAVSILLGSLNSVAKVLTMFFLITYAMINISVFLEQYLGLRSFRPMFKVPKIVPLYGALGSFVMMFLISPYAGVIAILFMIGIYMLLAHRPLRQSQGDVRSGLFRTLSEWAAQKTKRLPDSSMHTWKPNILIPVLTTRTLFGNFPLIKSIVSPHGTMTVLGFKLKKNLKKNPEKKNITKKEIEKELKELPKLVNKFSDEGIYTSYSTIDAEDYTNSVIVSLEAIESQVFAPNILFLPYKPHKLHKSDLKRIIKAAEDNDSGITIFDKDPRVSLGTEEDVHVWISPKTLENDLFEYRYYDLALLIAYSIKENWDGNINLWMCVDEEDEKKAKRYLSKLVYEARFPRSTSINIVNGDFKDTLKDAPDGDVHIIPFEKDDVDSITKIAKKEGKSYLFVLDSTKESVLA